MSKNKPSTSKGVQKSSVSKHHEAWAEYSQQQDNRLSIPKALEKELRDKEFAYRFISKSELKKNYGHRQGGWKPYKSDSYREEAAAFSEATDGYLHRGDLVLAVRPLWLHEAEKTKKELKNKLLENRQDKKAADELRKMFHGVKGVTIEDGDID